VQLNLTDEELEILAGVLESYLSDLREEITDTQREDFRESLRIRTKVIVKALEHIQAAVAS